jgi:hypothetical protein
MPQGPRYRGRRQAFSPGEGKACCFLWTRSRGKGPGIESCGTPPAHPRHMRVLFCFCSLLFLHRLEKNRGSLLSCTPHGAAILWYSATAVAGGFFRDALSVLIYLDEPRREGFEWLYCEIPSLDYLPDVPEARLDLLLTERKLDCRLGQAGGARRPGPDEPLDINIRGRGARAKMN